MEVLILNDQQLRKLIHGVYGKEITAIDTINFRDGDEAREHRNDCYFNYQTVEGLLADCVMLQNMFNETDARAHIAQNISSYLLCCANSAFMMLDNYSVRKTYLEKVRAHANSLIVELKEATPSYTAAGEEATQISYTAEVGHIDRRIDMYLKTEMEYLRMFQSGASESYSKWLKDQGWTFEQLLDTYKAQLLFEKPFADLEEEEKLQVYEKIIEASGRGKVTFDKSLLKMTYRRPMLSESGHISGHIYGGARAGSEGKDVDGTASLIYKAGKTVWDIYSSEHRIETAVRLAVNAAAKKAGVAIGEAIAAAVATKLLVGAGENSIFVFTAGVVSGFVSAGAGTAAVFIISAVSGKVLDMIFQSGGKEASIPYQRHCYTMEGLPSNYGMDLARQIAYNKA